MRRVRTGCTNCKRCTNSGFAEFGRRQTKLWTNVMTAGIPAMVQAFTPTCRACGHKRSLHAANRQMAPVVVQPAGLTPVDVQPGWYPDPDGAPCMRWWDGQRWTGSTAPGMSS